MLWACIGASDVGNLVFIEGNMDKLTYVPLTFEGKLALPWKTALR